ncbi:MAG: winged helix-turn-helix transcriptional regulator [Chloroflexi bacterium]|jgi:DNA-binding MarR family transcriptional regulator|nr:winged helix-turn-helix transcriptional regulator [Chloroflexota bacterium]MBT3670067.1 winged helix-turn-helix transcriptional regulator [Chloroflexota bacterium]MBT4002218.1 winged helix-turn-helix transcriptional regulator [Chloroflexota bacterium]MBT4306731.1 winged helix-turn-helix transcriptional regulator [Chloroflexota bacterium]MBT4532953.1 winged helix-turn-helix transcriptional regulator [Chloroflexota bacterium]
MKSSKEAVRDLSLLEEIEKDPDITQASMANQLDVAVGTVNWHIKRLINKGYVKVKRAQRRKLRYIITPEGITFRARLTIEYVERSLSLYRVTRKQVTQFLQEINAVGYDSIKINSELQGPDDILDICRLTCLEQNIQILEEGEIPELVIQGGEVKLHLPEKI